MEKKIILITGTSSGFGQQQCKGAIHEFLVCIWHAGDVELKKYC